MVEKLIEIFAKWPPLGQGFFALVVLGMIAAAFAAPFKYLAVCVRGWPAQHFECADDDDDEVEATRDY